MRVGTAAVKYFQKEGLKQGLAVLAATYAAGWSMSAAERRPLPFTLRVSRTMREENPFSPSFLHVLESPSLLTVVNQEQLAELLGVSYKQLAMTVFGTSASRKYRTFQIPKSSGEPRLIMAPNPRLRTLQRRLKDELYRVHRPHRDAHGFVQHRNIKTNATPHVGTRYLLNIDLQDYFDTVNFGRVWGLFRSAPFHYESGLAAVLANICCHDNRLPQGAPTSPIVANMLSSRMDARLSNLARTHDAIYTRYADDMTFSFFCGRARLPKAIVEVNGDKVEVGSTLRAIIDEEGFNINERKTRLASRTTRMDVTGITVNEFPNVSRRYVRDIGSMLNAWRRYGEDAALQRFIERYDPHYRKRNPPTSFEDIVRGRLVFLRSVRGERGDVYNRLAARFNELCAPSAPRLPLVDNRTPLQRAENEVWVLEACEPQGTGVRLQGDLVLTCAHVLWDTLNQREKGLPCGFRPGESQGDRFRLKLIAIDLTRDLAVYEFEGPRAPVLDDFPVLLSKRDPVKDQQVRYVGMPRYQPGDPFHAGDSTIGRVRSGGQVPKFDLNATVLKGMSGGPVFDTEGRLLGVIAHHAENGEGNNSAISLQAIVDFLREHGLGERVGL